MSAECTSIRETVRVQQAQASKESRPWVQHPQARTMLHSLKNVMGQGGATTPAGQHWAPPMFSVVVIFFDSRLCVDCCRNSSLSYSWATGSKSSRFSSSNRSHVVISRTRPQDVRWNAWEDINWVLVWFFSSISHVFLPASICVSAVVPNPVLRADSFSIAMRSWRS
jgi:hypothetical protein